MGILVLFFIIVLIELWLFMLVLRQIMVLLMYGIRIWLVRNLGELVDMEVILFILVQKLMVVLSVFLLVCRLLMILMFFCIGIGFMKCVEMMCDEVERFVGLFVVVVVIWVMEMEDVFVVRMVCFGQYLVSCLKILNLRFGILGMVLMMKFMLERFLILVLGDSSDCVLLVCFCVIFDLEIFFVSSFFVQSVSCFDLIL